MNGFADELLDFLRQQPGFGLFLVLALGHLIGRIRIGIFSFGPVAGVLFAGIVFGRMGFSMRPGVQAVGFAVFIFSVGYQAGPRFVDVIRADGARYFLLAAFVTGSGIALTYLWSWLMQLPLGSAAGLLAGGMTSSSTLAAAQEAVRSGNVAPPPGVTADQLIGNITTTYAITYIFGLTGLIAVIKLLPVVLRIDLVGDARKLEHRSSIGATVTDIRSRGYRVTNPAFCRMTAAELREKYWDRLSATYLYRDGRLIPLEAGEHLRPGDELYVRGELSQFLQGLADIGEEIPVPREVGLAAEVAQVIVARRQIVGRCIEELDLSRRLGLVVTGVRRERIPIPVSPDQRLKRGDVLTVMGPSDRIAELNSEIGPVEEDIVQTDMLTFAGGIAVGLLFGLVSIPVGGVSIGLGSAGGLLASGILVGLLNATRPTIGKFPDAARWIFMEFGLLIFMTGVGLSAGADVVETLRQAGPNLVLAGATVALVPVCGGYVFGRMLLGMEPVLLLGALTGSMTSGASLKIVTDAAKSSAPALGYTGCYAFANVLLTLTGTLMMSL